MIAVGRKMGHFIALEGGEGSGKSSQARKLGDALLECGIPALVTREPGGTPTAERIRSMLLDPENAYDPRTEVLLHFAARADHVHRFIYPQIKAGKWVICDRYWFSTFVYQGFGLGVPFGLMDPLCELVGLAPDLTIFLDLPEELAAKRRTARSGATDRYEEMDSVFHRKVIDSYRKVASMFEEENCVIVDATGTKNDVHNAVLDVVEKKLGVKINA